MKRTALVLTVLIVLVPSTGVAQLCVNPISVKSTDSRLARINTIKNALASPCAKLIDQDTCEICFVGDMANIPMTAATIWNTALPNGFQLQIASTETREIQIKGLKLRNDSVEPLANTFLSVTNAGTGIVKLNDVSFVDVKDGLSLQGSGPIELRSSTITGDAAKSGACVAVASPSALLDHVDVSNCGDGVRVDADNVRIANESSIHGNKIGVHILQGRIGTKIDSSLVYGNDDLDVSTPMKDDGIRIDGGVMHEAVLYDVVGNDAVPVPDDNQPYDYQDRKPYILLDLPKGQKGAIEFYLSSETECGLPALVRSKNQTCAVVKAGTPPVATRIEVDQAQLETDKIVDVALPDELKNKRVVTVYTDPQQGTAGISRQFVFGTGIVAVIAVPEDIPLSMPGFTDPTDDGGTTDDPASPTDGTGTSTGTSGVSEMGDDGAGVTSGGAAAGAKCTLMKGAQGNSADIVILMLTVLSTLFLSRRMLRHRASMRRS
jgi:hypothetical protein